MTTIVLQTEIDAPVEIVFDLARSIDVHMESANKTKEKAIAGVTSGLIGLGETVTWKGRHFGFMIRHKSKITQYYFPKFFADEMEEGLFQSFRHEHYFTEINGKTMMTDNLKYETPYWVFGRLFDQWLLKKHLTDFLLSRNAFLKKTAENRFS